MPGNENSIADALLRIQAQRRVQPVRQAISHFNGKPRPSSDSHERREWLMEHPTARVMRGIEMAELD